jgi:hypothetical protein
MLACLFRMLGAALIVVTHVAQTGETSQGDPALSVVPGSVQTFGDRSGSRTRSAPNWSWSGGTLHDGIAAERRTPWRQ